MIMPFGDPKRREIDGGNGETESTCGGVRLDAFFEKTVRINQRNQRIKEAGNKTRLTVLSTCSGRFCIPK